MQLSREIVIVLRTSVLERTYLRSIRDADRLYFINTDDTLDQKYAGDFAVFNAVVWNSLP